MGTNSITLISVFLMILMIFLGKKGLQHLGNNLAIALRDFRREFHHDDEAN